MTAKSYSIAGLVACAILGLTDFVLTYDLIRRNAGRIYESNPVAAAWLKDFGWKGLAVFKAAAIIIVVVLVLIIRQRKPRTAAVLITAACLLLLAVTIYSRVLLTRQSETGRRQHIPPTIVAAETM